MSSSATTKTKDPDDSKSQVTVEDEEYDEDILSVYEMLKNKNDKVSVDSIFKWGEIKDLIDEGDISMEEVNDLLAKASSSSSTADKPSELNKKEFLKFVQLVTDLMDYTEIQSEELEELFDNLRDKDKDLSIQKFLLWEDVQQALAQNIVTKDDIDAAVDEVCPGNAKDLGRSINFDQFKLLVSKLDAMTFEGGEEESESFDDLSEDVEDDLRELFDELRGKEETVTLAAFKKLPDVKDLIESGYITVDEVDAAIDKTLGKKGISKVETTKIGFETFSELIQFIDDMAADNEEASEDELTDDELFTEIFDSIKGAKGKVTLQTFFAWDAVTSGIAEGLITKEKIDELIDKVVGVKGASKNPKTLLDLSQFKSLAAQMEEEVSLKDGGIIDVEAEEVTDSKSNLPVAVSKAPVKTEGEADGAESDEDDDVEEELIEDIFDKIADKNGKLSLKAFNNWEDLKELISDGAISKELVNEIVADVLQGKSTTISKEQFVEIVDRIDRLTDEGEEEDDDDDDDDYEEDFDASKVFDEIADKNGKLSFKAFNNWKDLKELISDGLISKEQLDEIVADVVKGKPSSFSKEQFVEIVDRIEGLIDEFDGTEDEDDEGNDEDYYDDKDDDPSEIFDEIADKNGKLSLKAFNKWEDLEDFISDGAISREQVNKIVADVLKGKSTTISREQFVEIVDKIAIITDEKGDEKGDRELAKNDVVKSASDEEEDVIMSDDEAAADIFDELSKDPKKEKLAVKDFLAWQEIKELFDKDLIDMDTMRILVTEVGAKMTGDLTLQQFTSLLQLVDETTIAMSSSDEEEESILQNYTDITG